MGFEHGKSEVSHSGGVTWVFGYAGLEFCRVSCAGDLWAMRPQVKAWESDLRKNIKDRMLFYVVPEVRDIGGQGRRVDIPEIPSKKGSRG